MILPNALKKGDTIGIISSGDPITPHKLEEINASILLMERAGFQIQFSKHAFSNTLGYSATVQEKAEDINTMFQEDNIKAIFFSTGGTNSNSVFDYLDYEMIQNHPKILCGFSDATSITNVIYQKTGLVTFNGATFKSLTSWDTDYGYQEVIKRLVDKKLELGTKEDEYRTIQPGKAEGRLVGGNLSLTAWLASGAYQLDFTDTILCIEETGLESDPGLLSHYLYHMKQNKVFDKIKGIWIGNYEHASGITLEKVVQDVLEDNDTFPIIKSNNFGHTDKKTVIPIGVMAKMDTNEDRKIQLLEPCVR